MSEDTLQLTIDSFVVAQLSANELGEAVKYNVQFIEYLIPPTYTELITQVKEEEENWTELADGALRLHKVIYTEPEMATVESTEAEDDNTEVITDVEEATEVEEEENIE